MPFGHNVSGSTRWASLVVVIATQVVCAGFFYWDVATDLSRPGEGDPAHLVMEAAAAVALVAGLPFLVDALREMNRRLRSMDDGLRAARGEMREVLRRRFAEWELTPSEREVALLILNGHDNESIARIRATALGTVRAQCARIYHKSGVEGRGQFVSLFLAELLSGPDEPSIPPQAEAATAG